MGAWIGDVATRPSSTPKSPLHHYNSQTVSFASESNVATLEKTMPRYDPVAQFCAEAPRESAQVVTWIGNRNGRRDKFEEGSTSR